MTGAVSAIVVHDVTPTAGGNAKLFRRMLRDKVTVTALTVLAVVVAGCALAPWLAPYSPFDQDLQNVLSGPSGAHPLGTDTLGRDVLSRLMYGGRTTLLAVAVAIAVHCAIGISVGLVAGYRGGLLDRVVAVLVDLLMSVPGIVVLLSVAAVFQHNEYATMCTLGFFASGGLIRIVRAETRAVREELYVTAAVIAGVTTRAILVRHILPRLLGPIIVKISLFAGVALGIEAGMGFLNLGVTPPSPSWGNLVGEAFSVINSHPYLLLPAGGTLALVTLCCALVGDGVRVASRDRRQDRVSARVVRRVIGRARDRSTEQEPAAPAANDALLAVEAMDVTFVTAAGERDVISGVTFDLRPGELVALVGESGSGKTMTAMAVLGLLPPNGFISSGSVSLRGTRIDRLPEKEMSRIRGSRIALISQEPMVCLDPSFTVGDQLVEVIRTHEKMPKARAREVAADLLRTVRLREPEQIMGKYAHELSGGMAQRVAIAMALSGKPDLLIADEPTTALDVTVQAEILDLLRGLSATLGMAILLVTHDLGVVADLCERVIVMQRGRIVEEAKVLDVFTSPKHPYTRDLIAATPSLVRIDT
ncbi:dipeptide/oligopeptide/nickel ABC transporter permease/ATP-binding protein [Streptomyces sp. NBC_00988]|uniref:dipeptide/oligopeptide/nickel ABC transporter permease/ATP-binding protein n=1 Tax=Streptomyces sp. NBC_00988 TaxID=2903704 RepID=UPI00386FF6B8|nr:dipeptide/oligopeptide/nickel ABC transporter permease/ATP-binding protein [Streptomyces sp. NBC_00988]